MNLINLLFFSVSTCKRWLLKIFNFTSDHRKTFTHIFSKNFWHGKESISGTGSDLTNTIIIRKELPKIIKKYEITSLLDAACGDFNWMKQINLDLDQYIGIDIVKRLIENNKKNYSNNKQTFMHLDISKDNLPKSDLILCRDCLVHYPYALIFAILKNFKKSGSKYLLTTTFPKKESNIDITHAGYDWRPLNLELSPFNFPKPLLIINEGYTTIPSFADKSIALWKLDELDI